MSKSPPTTPAGSLPPAVDPALLGRHEAGLRTYLSGLQGAKPDQVDAVIRDVMREAPSQREFEDDPVTWLFAEGRRRMASGAQRGDVLAGDTNDEEPVAGEDPAIVVHRAFGRLTYKQQEMLRLKFQFGFNLAELAAITGVSQAGAGGLLHAAVERICRASGATMSLGEGRGGDVRLTTYALDELTPAEKKSFVESVPDARALLESSDAIRKVGQQLTRVLESGAPLPKRKRRGRGATWWHSAGAWLAGLAVIALAAVAWYFVGRSGETGPTHADAVATASGESIGRASARDDGAEEARGSAGGSITTSYPTGSTRALRPGEAAWERKPFGHGHGVAASGAADGGGGDPAQPGGEEGPASAGGGSASTGAPSDPGGHDDPSAGKRGERSESDRAMHPGTDDDDPIDETMPSLGAAIGFAGAGASSAVGNPGGARAMKPAQPNVTDQAAKAPVDPAEASRIPAKHPQLPGIAPLKRQLAARQWPKPSDVRVGPMMKQAPPDPPSTGAADEPLSARIEITNSPWNPDRQIVRATVRARAARAPARAPVSLVFAIDVSGSMAGPNRLPLVEEGIRLLADRLRPEDRVAVVTYAAQAKEILPGNPLGAKGLELRNCLTTLEAAGQTNGYEGLRLAYDTARRNRVDPGLNVVVLCTDGNFNLGETDEKALAALAAQASADGIKLSVFGFGRSDRNDLRLELLASQGGGRSCYVNTEEEAERLLAGQIDGLVSTVATDVAFGVKFDSDRVTAVGRIDGAGDRANHAPIGELLSGRSLTALYEVRLRADARVQGPLAELAVDYRLPGSPQSGYLVRECDGMIRDWMQLDPSFRFAIAWAEFGRIMQVPRAEAGRGLDRLEAWVRQYLPEDTGGYRSELLDSVAAARLAANRL